VLKHRCADSWLRAERMLLASLDANDEGHAIVVAELGDCAACWRSLALHLLGTLANGRALTARSRQRAADTVLRGIARYAMPGAIPDPERG
jgi:hypothetical protein